MNAKLNAKPQSIKVEAAALDDFAGKTILRGVISMASLQHLVVDDYQREELTANQRSSIFKALENNEPLPDFELGMRSEKFRAPKPNEVFLHDFVYVIDGLQRLKTVLEFIETHPEAKIRAGAKIFLGTTREWERERFHILNAERTRVSANILFRNLKEDSVAVAMLLGLTKNDKNFVLHDRVCWTQQMSRQELMNITSFAKVVAMLHSHKGPNNMRTAASTASSLDKIVQTVGLQIVRENTKAFFALVDECWGIRRIHYRGKASYLKNTFLMTLAKLLSDHYMFWKDPDEKRFFVDAPLRRKLTQFAVNDVEVERLSGSGGKAGYILYLMIRDHLNSGKRTKRLVSRNGETVALATNGDESEDEEDGQKLLKVA